MKKFGNLPQIIDLGITNFFTCHTCLTSLDALRAGLYRNKSPDARSQRLQTKGNKIKLHDMALRDRKEQITIEGNVYEMTLVWNIDLLRRSAVGMPPDYAHITKNGSNYAVIHCTSNLNGFIVEAFHLAMEAPEWRMKFDYLNINTIPFKDILVRLPL